MYAVFRSGGKQYRASKGDVLRLEKIDAGEGAKIQFDDVLLVGEGGDIKVGKPLLSGSAVTATVLRQGKSRKIGVVKFKRRQNYLRQHGHRQYFTEVEITGIGAGSAKKTSSAAETSEKPAAKKKAAKKATTKKASTKKSASKKTAAKKTAKKKPAAKKASKKSSD